MTEPELKLPRRAEELLRELPVVEPDFDAQAKAIEARLASAKAEAVSDDLFKAPDLAPESREPGREPAAASRAVAKGGLAEMARKSVQKADDDAAALAKELLAATAQRSRPSAEVVERIKAASRVPAPPPAAASASVTSTPLPSEPERPSGVVTRADARAAQAAPAAAAPSSGTKRGMLIGFVGGALAVAAAALLFIKTESKEAPSPTTAALAAERASELASPQPSAGAVAAAQKPTEPVLSPDALPPAAPELAHAESPKAGAMPAPAAAAPPSKAGPEAAPPAAPGAKPEAVVLEDDPEPQKAQAPEKKAEPPAEPQLKPAEGSTSSVPLSPSAGAVSTALSSVRSGAQACLAGQTESVTAVVTFAADGHVQSVSAGGPSGACIQAALSRAHIAPFAKPTFSATTTVRPP